MIEIIGEFNTAKCFTGQIEDVAREQIKQVCDTEAFASSKIRIMPDVHAGKGCTIGTTMTITDKIVPAMVGVDIGCGMYTVALGKVDIDLEKMLGDMLEDNELGIDISALDINEYAKMGKAVTVKSKRTVGSEFADITYIEADQTAIMVSLMRFIAGMLKDPEADIMGTLMGSSLGENQMVSGFVDGIAEDIDNMSVDQTVEWMYKIFFRERPIVEETQEEEYLPTIIYKPKNNFSGAGIFVAILILVLGELIYIKEKVRINRFVKRKLEDFKDMKKRINQEV